MTTKTRRAALLFGFLSCTALAATGCGEVDQAVDCNNICDAYTDCIPEADRSECFDRCEDLPDAEADECDACLDANSCIECAAECGGVAG